jgi:hypothetical protein
LPVIKDFKLYENKDIIPFLIKTIPGANNIINSKQKIEDALNVVKRVSKMMFLYKIHESKFIENDKIYLNKTVFKIKNREKIYSTPDYVIIYCATMGDKIDSYINNLVLEDKILESYYLKHIASVYLEICIEYIIRDLKVMIVSRYGNNIKFSCSYSPGYKNWDISEQKILLQILMSKRIGISIDENYIMTPQISISGMISFGKKVESKNITCNFCSEEECYMKYIYDFV